MKVTIQGKEPVNIEFTRASRVAFLIFSQAQTSGAPKDKYESGLSLIHESLKNLADIPLVEQIMDDVPSAYFEFLNAAVETYIEGTSKAIFEKK